MGEVCSQEPQYSDGPAAVESDEICKQHCLNGDKNNSPHSPHSVTASAQQSSDGQVSLQWKNPDFLLKNPDFLSRNPDFLLKTLVEKC